MNLVKIAQFSFGPILSALISLITLPLLTWFYGTEDIGKLTMLQVVVSFSVVLISLAMHQAYVREYHESKNIESLFITSTFPGSLFFCILLIIYWVSPYKVSSILFGDDNILISLTIFLCIFLSFLANMLAHVLRMEERALAYSFSLILPKISLLLFIVFIIKSEFIFGYESLVYSFLLSLVTLVITLIYLLRSFIRDTMFAKLDIKLLKQMLSYALPLVASGIIYWAINTMDRIYLKEYSGLDSVAVYAVAATFSSTVTVLTSVFSSIWHPTVYKWVNNKEDVKNKVIPIINGVFGLITLVWSASMVFSYLLLFLLPNEYKEVQYILIGCIVMPLLYLLSETTVIGLNIKRKSIFNMYAAITAFVINGILNYLLIPLYGARGAAIASSISFFIYFVIRTEASCYFWKPIPRAKMYLILLCYLIAASYIVLLKISSIKMGLIGISIFICSLFLYWAEINISYKKFKEIKEG